MKISKIVALASVLAVSGSAFAGTATNTLTINASVSNACTVSSATLDFGTYDPAASSAKTASTSLSSTCTSDASYTLDVAANTGSMVGHNNGDSLGYSLFSDDQYSVAWASQSLSGTGSAQSTTLYGSLAAGQNVSADSYADSQTITVSY